MHKMFRMVSTIKISPNTRAKVARNLMNWCRNAEIQCPAYYLRKVKRRES